MDIFKSKILVAVLAVLIVGAISFLSYKIFYSPVSPEIREELALEAPKTETPAEPAKTQPAPEKLARPKPEAPKIFPGFRIYKNAEFGFEIQYPIPWAVSEEINENVRGEMVKEYFFKKPSSDARFAILPRDGLSYGIGVKGTSTPVFIGGSSGVGTQYVLEDGRRLWLLFPQYGLNNWLQDLGRIDAMTSIEDPIGDTGIFEMMLNSFKFLK